MLRSGSYRVLGDGREGRREGCLCSPHHRMRPGLSFCSVEDSTCVYWALQSEQWCAGDSVSSESSPAAPNGKPDSIQIRNGERMFSRTHLSPHCWATAALLHPSFFLWHLEPPGGRGRMRQRVLVRERALIHPDPSAGPLLSCNCSVGQNNRS